MKSFFSAVDSLGGQIESDLRRANGDLRRLPEIADGVLSEFSDLDGVDLTTLARFISQTKIPQQSTNPFSDLPVTIYKSRDFYIEILAWTHSTTAIHQHGFGGAFRVVGGSSIHTRYCFESQERVTDDLLIGDIYPINSEYLSIGLVRRIDPGMTGLVHSLYHLDNPSITLVVRDYGHLAFGPQYNYFPPSIALNQPALKKDELISMFARLIELSGRLDRSIFMSLWCEHIANLEFPRLAWLYIKYWKYLSGDERAKFRTVAERSHGVLTMHLFDCVDFHANRSLLSRMRERIQDAELRFFLALLMNVPEKENLLEMVAVRYPGLDPIDRCADWLVRLSVDDKIAQDRMVEMAQMFESNGLRAMQFSRQLQKALPVGTGAEEAQSIFSGFISGEIESMGVSKESIEALAALPQLSALRS